MMGGAPASRLRTRRRLRRRSLSWYWRGSGRPRCCQATRSRRIYWSMLVKTRRGQSTLLPQPCLLSRQHLQQLPPRPRQGGSARGIRSRALRNQAARLQPPLVQRWRRRQHRQRCHGPPAGSACCNHRCSSRALPPQLLQKRQQPRSRKRRPLATGLTAQRSTKSCSAGRHGSSGRSLRCATIRAQSGTMWVASPAGQRPRFAVPWVPGVCLLCLRLKARHAAGARLAASPVGAPQAPHHLLPLCPSLRRGACSSPAVMTARSRHCGTPAKAAAVPRRIASSEPGCKTPASCARLGRPW